jgi:hypothetical protein
MIVKRSAQLVALSWFGVGLWAFQSAQSDSAKKPVPPYSKSAEAAKPYPQTQPPEKYGHPVLQKVYKTAKDIPGVLAQQPCYCYCDKHGHGSLLHCHRDDHSAG